MKKLLGLLGAAGLVATTSATVVACGDKDTVKTDLSKMELTVASGLTEEAAKKSIESQITAKVKDAKITTDYTITVEKSTSTYEGTEEENLADGTKITVAATKDSKLLTGSKTITIGTSTTPEEDKKDLGNLSVEIKADLTEADAKTKIKEAIVTLSQEAVENTDYTITYKAKNTEGLYALTSGDTFEVKATANSKLLTGSIIITVIAAE
ncbi:lipoprotein [Spiroplasma endosymbiont of Cantharis rufa]|uniref:lipoprotein n=1 Tax=Spiroplasma endosymbiont of Cantharis rufa TaxID=3066279 RepID=UPI0030CAC460